MEKIDAMHKRIKNINLEIAQERKKGIYLGSCAISLLFLSFFVLVTPIIVMSEVLIPLATFFEALFSLVALSVAFTRTVLLIE